MVSLWKMSGYTWSLANKLNAYFMGFSSPRLVVVALLSLRVLMVN